MQVVYMLIQVKYGTITKVADTLLSFKEIENVHKLFGQYDVLIKIKMKDMRVIENFIDTNIRKIKEIERTETLVVSDISS